MVSDRMTPEFKLNSEDFIKRDSRANSSSVNDDGLQHIVDGMGMGNYNNHHSNMKKRLVRAFTVEDEVKETIDQKEYS